MEPIDFYPMKKYESPMFFLTRQTINGLEISYSDLMEVCQGGPEVGILSVNGNPIPSYRFGGPLLYNNGYLYAPAFDRRWLFKLAEIDVRTLDVTVRGESQKVIFFDRMENKRLYFFQDMEKTLSAYYEL
jgi:hypothetical protein